MEHKKERKRIKKKNAGGREVVSNLTGGCANTTLLRKVTLQGHTPLQKTFNSPPRGMGQTPLSELALRVQLSGVPPAYGSWLLTPQPPLHEGEEQPVRQKGSGKRATSKKSIQVARSLPLLVRLDTDTAWRRRSTPRRRFSESHKGLGRVHVLIAS